MADKSANKIFKLTKKWRSKWRQDNNSITMKEAMVGLLLMKAGCCELKFEVNAQKWITGFSFHVRTVLQTVHRAHAPLLLASTRGQQVTCSSHIG